MGLVDKFVKFIFSKKGAIVLGGFGIAYTLYKNGQTSSTEIEECPYCGGDMTFHDSELEYFQYWECHDCGETFYEEELLEVRDELKEDFSEKPSLLDDILDMPPGCRACGGDYPNCITSCNMFED